MSLCAICGHAAAEHSTAKKRRRQCLTVDCECEHYTEPAAEPSYADPVTCGCGGAFVFDPLLEGETCGGLYRIGWLRCSSCSTTRVTKRGRSIGGPWKLAAGGRSLHAEGLKIRAEAGAGGADVTAVMERLVKLPDLEAALRQIARGEISIEQATELARSALGLGPVESPYVCPGCHAVAPDRCVPGCIDAEIEEEDRHAIESGNCDKRTDSDPDEEEAASQRGGAW